MKSVSLLPESDDVTVCVRLTGLVTTEDYIQNYHNEIKRRAEKYGFFNLLVFYDENFKGWEENAAEQNFKSICELGDKPYKLAYVNPRESKIMLMKLAQPLMRAEIRYYDPGDLDEALRWIKERAE